MDTPTIGMAIRRHRERQGLKQADLAIRLGLTKDGQPHISDIERGKTPVPALTEIIRIEEALGLNRGQLLIDAGYVALPQTVAEAIDADPALSPQWRSLVRTAYETAVTGSAREGWAAATDGAAPKKRSRTRA